LYRLAEQFLDSAALERLIPPCSSPPSRISDDGHQRRQQRAG
jgi:hypothetical protein